MQEKKHMITIKETSKLFSLSEYEIRRGISAGDYPALRCGVGKGRYLIDADLFAENLRILCQSNLRTDSNIAHRSKSKHIGVIPLPKTSSL